jgi:hypothetical protein
VYDLETMAEIVCGVVSSCIVLRRKWNPMLSILSWRFDLFLRRSCLYASSFDGGAASILLVA